MAIVIAEMLTIVLIMSRQGGFDMLLRDFAVLSLFIVWIVLTDIALLCLLTRMGERYSPEVIGVVAFFLLQLVTLFYTSAVYWFSPTFLITPQWSASWLWEYGVRNLIISMIVSLIALRYFYIQHQRLLVVQAESRARIDALQARIRPHFLFNSMNIIASLTRIDPAQAERTVEDLADLFRASLNTQQDSHTLEDELQLARSYLRIEHQRLGDRLKVEWQTTAPLPRLLVPPLIIQPLVENTIYHGIEKIPEGGTVYIDVRPCGVNHYCVEIRNPVNEPGVTGRVANRQAHYSGNHMAHENIVQRLALAFGDKARLTHRASGGEYHVTLRLPISEPDR